MNGPVVPTSPSRHSRRGRRLDRKANPTRGAGASQFGPPPAVLRERDSPARGDAVSSGGGWVLSERQIRPAVILRKNSQCNRSERTNATRAVMMTIYRTPKSRDHDPRTVIEAGLRQWSATDKLPPLPAAVVGIG